MLFFFSKCHWNTHLLVERDKKKIFHYKLKYLCNVHSELGIYNIVRTNERVPLLSFSAWSSIDFPILFFHCQTGPAIPSFPCASWSLCSPTAYVGPWQLCECQWKRVSARLCLLWTVSWKLGAVFIWRSLTCR